MAHINKSFTCEKILAPREKISSQLKIKKKNQTNNRSCVQVVVPVNLTRKVFDG